MKHYVTALVVSFLATFSFSACAKNFDRDEWPDARHGRDIGVDYKAGIEVIPGGGNNTTVSGVVFSDRDLDGRLDRWERGIRGVAVSNGVDVVQTDAHGRYEIAVSAGQTLFITKPADYALPVDEYNVPQFYYHHLPQGSPPLRFGGLPATGPLPGTVNFPLVWTGKKHRFKIAVSGDTQPYSNNEVGYVRDSVANELATMDDLAFFIIEGDILGDDLGLFPRFKRVVSVANTPVYFVPGNHDLDFDAPTDANSFDTFKREWGPTYYSFDIGDVHFVVLDNVKYPCTPEQDNVDGRHNFCNNPESRPAYNGVVTGEQIEWLANDLSYVPKDKLIVLNMHIPIVSFVDSGSTQHQVDNAEVLYDLLEGRPALALSGHTHTLEQFRPGESFAGWQSALGIGPTPFPQIITGAACGSWWSGDFNDDGIPVSIQRLGAPRGYLLFEFDGNTYKDRFKAAGKPIEKQMSVDFLSPTFLQWHEQLTTWLNTDPAVRDATPPVNINDLPDTGIVTRADIDDGTYVSVNVWNGSRDSKVKIKIDGGKQVLTAERTQSGQGEGILETLDPAALKRQLYVFRYAARSTSGNERAQGFELFRGSRFGPADPQPLSESMLTDQSNHVWIAPLPADLEPGIHTLTVETVDVHGQRYTEHKTFEVMDNRPPPFARTELFQ